MNDWMGFDPAFSRSRTFAACVFVGFATAAVLVVVLVATGVLP